MRTDRINIALAVLGVTAVAGCGGSSGLSKSDLISKANAICATANAKARSIATPTDIRNGAQAATYFDQIAALADDELAKIKALKPDSGVKSEWDAAVGKFAAVVGLIDQAKAKADARDPSGLALLTQIKTATDDANASAKAFGANTCASS